METSPKTLTLILIFVICTFFLVDITYKRMLVTDVNKSIEEASVGGIQRSINRGSLRVNRKMTIDHEKFKGHFNTIYSQNQSVKNAAETPSFYDYSEFPPMYAVQVQGMSKSLFNSYTSEGENLTHLKREIVILEKK